MKTITSLKNKGFTLIELIIVIVLLGLLAAAALPKFSDLESKARAASEDGVIGAFRSAIAISHADWLANNKAASITLEGTSITMSTEGYPEYTSTAGTAGTMTDAKCAEVYNGILSNPPEGSATTCTGTCQVKITVATDTTQCYLDFNQGASGETRATYDINTGSVSKGTVP